MVKNQNNRLDNLASRLGWTKPLAIVANDKENEIGYAGGKFFTQQLINNPEKLTDKDKKAIISDHIASLIVTHEQKDNLLRIGATSQLSDKLYGWMDEGQREKYFNAVRDSDLLLEYWEILYSGECALRNDFKESFYDWFNEPTNHNDLNDAFMRFQIDQSVSFCPNFSEAENEDLYAQCKEFTDEKEESGYGRVYIYREWDNLLDRMTHDNLRSDIFYNLAVYNRDWQIIATAYPEGMRQNGNYSTAKKKILTNKDTHRVMREEFSRRAKVYTPALERLFAEDERFPQKLFEIYKDTDLLYYLSSTLRHHVNAFPKGTLKQFEKWASQNKIDLDTLPMPALISPAHGVFKDRMLRPHNHAEQSNGYTIAQKQAFFDGMPLPMLEIRKHMRERYNVPYDEGTKYSHIVNNAVLNEKNNNSILIKRLRAASTIPDDQYKAHEASVNLMSCFKRGTEVVLSVSPAKDSKFLFDDDHTIWNKGLKVTKTRNYLFESARRNNFIPELYFLLNTYDSYAPDGTIDRFVEWCEGKDINLDQILNNYELPEMDNIEAVIQAGFDARKNISISDDVEETLDGSELAQNAQYTVDQKQAFFNNVDMHPLRWAFAARDEISTQADNPIVDQINIVAHDGSHKTRLSRVWKYISGLDLEGMRRFQFLTSLAGANRRGTQDKVKRGAVSTADPYKFAQEQWVSALNHDPTFTGLLKSAVDNEFMAELYFMLNSDDSYAPEGTAEAIRGFCDGYGGVGYLDKILEDYELPNVENIEELVFEKIQENDEPSNDNDDIPDDLDFTPIDGLHVTAGGAEEPIAVDVKRKPKSEPSEREPVNHIPLIKEKLSNHLDIDGEVDVFGSMLAAKKIAKGEVDYELKILQFKTTDGQLHQIATNNWLGNGTQIIKPPVEIDVTQAKLIDITELRENDSAWPIRHKTEDSYLEDIAHHCRTPKDELTPYLPKFYGWSNDRQIVEKSIDTCAEFLRTTGKKIASNDRKPFECGALKAVTTPNRMFSSLDTMGFEDREELYAYVFAEHPELEAHIGKPAVSAKNAFNEVADIIAETEMVPQLLLADDYEVCDSPLAEISEFFSLSEKGCVTDWKPLMKDPMQKKIPENWDQFMIASGIAVRKDGALEPNWDHPELIKRRGEPKQRVA